MLDINIRVVTFLINHPAYYKSLKYFLAAWRINAGNYYGNVRFTVIFPSVLEQKYIHVINELVLEYPIDLMQVSADIDAIYQYYWPMRFLDEAFDEDLVIFSTPNTLVTNDISQIIEQAYRDNAVLAPALADSDAIGLSDTGMLSTWFMVLPKTLRTNIANRFLSILTRLGFPANPPPQYHDSIKLLAEAFTILLRENNIVHNFLDANIFHEFDGRQSVYGQQRIDTNYDEQVLFSVTDVPENEFTWSGIFSDTAALLKFLDNSELVEAWLYFQRDLRRIHTSFARSALQLARRDLFQAKSHPYYIFALDYMQQSAGIRALHYLCHALNESGLEAYVTCEGTAPHLRTPVLNETIMMQHTASGREAIMVYPEIVTGNPMGSGTVARWLLNRPGHIAGDTAFPDGDLIFTYDPHYLPAGMHGEILHIPTYDLSIFNNDDNPDDDAREFVCFYAHKYLASGAKLTEHAKDAISLCKDQPLTHAEIAAILRRSKLLYVYEPTALIAEALLCGCPVSIIQTDYWKNNMGDFIYAEDVGMIMDDSPASIASAKAHVHRYRSVHEDVVLKNAWQQIDHFVELTQDAARTR
ncbi:MAG: hypothetical protein P4L77_14765 [Sulfuriferula sp.]|nr:hypothetical protein [Sulfuriferula sp.]